MQLEWAKKVNRKIREMLIKLNDASAELKSKIDALTAPVKNYANITKDAWEGLATNE